MPLILRVCFVVATLWLPLTGHSNATEFPGPRAAAISPDGRYAVENVDSDKEPHHTLMLRNLETGTVRLLYSYPRHVSVLWSPNGQKLAVNDYAGSNFSKSLIFFVDQRGSAVDVRAKLFEFLKDAGARRAVSGNDHVYVVVLGWRGNDAVKVRVRGYGNVDPKGFTQFYWYTLGGSLQRAH
jgi:hypothetical protein